PQPDLSLQVPLAWPAVASAQPAPDRAGSGSSPHGGDPGRGRAPRDSYARWRDAHAPRQHQPPDRGASPRGEERGLPLVEVGSGDRCRCWRRLGALQGAEMTHPYALLARRRQERLGAPVLTTLPSPTIDFSKFNLPSSSSLTSLLKELKSAQQDSSNLSIPGFSPEDARGMLIQAIAEGGIDPKEFLGKFFSVGAAVACTAAGGAALAPLCAKGGQIIGEVVAGLQVKPSGPTNTAASDALDAMIHADSAMLKATKDSILFNLAARFNSEPKAMEEARKIVDEFYPDLSKLVPYPEYICISSDKASN